MKKEQPNKFDMVNHPPHYTTGKIEFIDFVEEMDFCTGNAIKYVARHQHKYATAEGKIEDLQKAKWYIDRLIARYKEQVEIN